MLRSLLSDCCSLNVVSLCLSVSFCAKCVCWEDFANYSSSALTDRGGSFSALRGAGGDLGYELLSNQSHRPLEALGFLNPVLSVHYLS